MGTFEKTTSDIASGTKNLLGLVGSVAWTYAVCKWTGLIPTKKKSELKVINFSDHNRYNYGDVILAITKSDMIDSRKNAAINLIKTDGSNDYYKAVYAIIESNMIDSRKLDALSDIKG